MRNTLGIITAFGITLQMTAATLAQDYVCPFGRNRGNSVADREQPVRYSDLYRPSGCSDGMCPFEARRYQQQLTSQDLDEGVLLGSAYDSRIPTRRKLHYDRSQTYKRHSDFGRSAIGDHRYDDSRQRSIYQQPIQIDRPTTYDRPLSDNRGFTSGPPPSFDRSPLTSLSPLGDFRKHLHDGNCKHGDSPASSLHRSLESGPSGNPAPRYDPTLREQLSTTPPQQQRSNELISEGPPSL